MVADRLGGRVVMIPDAGHYPQAEFPELTTPAIVEFARAVKRLEHGCLGPGCPAP